MKLPFLLGTCFNSELSCHFQIQWVCPHCLLLHKGEDPKRAGRNPFALGPLTDTVMGCRSAHACSSHADWFQQPCKLISLIQRLWWIQNLVFLLLFLIDNLSENYCQCLRYLHVPMFLVSLFIKKQLSLQRKLSFSSPLLREGKISNLQMQVLGNWKFPRISIFSKMNVRVIRTTKSKIQT